MEVFRVCPAVGVDACKRMEIIGGRLSLRCCCSGETLGLCSLLAVSRFMYAVSIDVTKLKMICFKLHNFDHATLRECRIVCFCKEINIV